jgi:hypothetical protein
MAKQHDGPRKVTLIGPTEGSSFIGQTTDGQQVIANLNGKAATAARILKMAQGAGLQVSAVVAQGDLTLTS